MCALTQLTTKVTAAETITITKWPYQREAPKSQQQMREHGWSAALAKSNTPTGWKLNE
jgi:hypothetical protein